MRPFEERSWALPALGVALLSAAIFSFVGCNRSADQDAGGLSAAAPSSLGKPVQGDVSTICAGCMSDEKLGETVAIEGEVVQQCPATGCWFRMKDDAGEVFVDLAPAKLRLTEAREGQHAKVSGRVMKQSGQFRLEAQHVEFGSAERGAPSSEK
ncbi:MAG: hypothetical protein HYX69_15255 [Planctomycetia bacterium]|nr:hypothetical protein [Planctomycetia bacterium]